MKNVWGHETIDSVCDAQRSQLYKRFNLTFRQFVIGLYFSTVEIEANYRKF